MEKMETAYFAGGCFWCITPTFREMDGVVSVDSGYAGGREANPTYADVKNQKTGHRETIRIAYLPERVSFEELCRVFISSVDPFDGGGQFIDRGYSYTLAIYYQSENQRQIAERTVRQLEQTARTPVYISIEPFSSYYSAEEDHQNYDLKYPEEFEQELIASGRIQKPNERGEHISGITSIG